MGFALPVRCNRPFDVSVRCGRSARVVLRLQLPTTLIVRPYCGSSSYDDEREQLATSSVGSQEGLELFPKLHFSHLISDTHTRVVLSLSGVVYGTYELMWPCWNPTPNHHHQQLNNLVNGLSHSHALRAFHTTSYNRDCDDGRKLAV